MNDTHRKLLISVAWLFFTISFISLSLENFLLRIADYDIYRVLNISTPDLLVLVSILAIQYLLLRRLPFHFNRVWQAAEAFKNSKLLLLAGMLLSSLLYMLFPSQFPFWIYIMLLGSLRLFYAFLHNLVTPTILKAACTLIFAAAMNSSLIFWMHEESNEGRHARYAQQLAEKRDTIAENILVKFAKLGQNLPDGIDKNDFWEKQWVNNDYLATNYRIKIAETTEEITAPYFQPILIKNATSVTEYHLIFPEKHTLVLTLNTDFRKSIYSTRQPFKNLEDLDDFHFAVIADSNIVLSNSHTFDPHILEVNLPPIGEGKKIELQGFDILAYRHAEEVFVLIGEPLSEVQVWISNFAFFFTLLLGVALLIEFIRFLILNKKVIHYWQELPIQFRIQIILLGMTCLLFFIIATTTFVFLTQNNAEISNERQLFISETLRNEISQQERLLGWQLKDFSVDFLAELADRKNCDIDFYTSDGKLLVSSFASAKNHPNSDVVKQKIIQQIEQNKSLILVKRQFSADDAPFLRTYFGIFDNDNLEGIASICSYESEIGTSPYIPIVMVKLLNVYVFLLLIVWAGGLLLIRLLTKPLELLADRLSKFKVGKLNKKLKWKGDDAIGQLIAEYNQMVDSVEVMTQELMRSEREGAWQVMAQQIAHEINNILTPLRLNVQFLTRIIERLEADESEAIERITHSLVEKIDALSKTATQFNLFAQLDSPDIKPIPLQAFLKAFFQNHPQKEGFDYQLKITLEDAQNPIIDIDVRHLEEVLSQLISNAENAIPEQQKGLIELKLKQDKKWIKIAIKDNGTGISSEVINNIFDPKFSVTSSQTGLGLPICKRIIEFYRGVLHFKTAPETGTTFFISFPLS